MVEILKNHQPQAIQAPPVELEAIKQFHQSISGYRATCLRQLPKLAHKLEINSLYVKDESSRFGLKAFKGMGASYAIYRFIKKWWENTYGVQFELNQLYNKSAIAQLNLPTFCTATDGNHGRAVAWFCRLLGLEAIVYIPKDSVPARIEKIKNEGAEVVLVDGSYDEAVLQCADDSSQFGYQVIADTAYDDYHIIPQHITEGYLTLLDEIDSTLEFDYIFVQCGVGSFAAAVVLFYKSIRQGRHPKIVLVEPTNSACVLESVKAGLRTQSRGSFETIMAGLNCGTPSQIAWPILRDGIDFFVTIDDLFATEAMCQYYSPIDDDQKIISGESGSAGLGALLALKKTNSYEKLGLSKNSKILLFNTEGDTDPENFARIIANSPN